MFVGNLPYVIEEETVWQYFEDACGSVVDVRVIRDRDTGKGKGFGYVKFRERKTVLDAIKLSGATLTGTTNKLRVTKVEKPGAGKGSDGVKGKGNERKNAKEPLGTRKAQGIPSREPRKPRHRKNAQKQKK